MTRKFDLMIHRHSRGPKNNTYSNNNSMGSVTIRCITFLLLWCALTTMMMSSPSSFVQSQFTPETTITWSSCASVESWVKSSRYASSTNSIIVANRETTEEKDMGTTIMTSVMMMENELENRMEARHVVHQQMSTEYQQKQSNNDDDGKHLVDCSAMRLPLIWDSTSDKRNVHFFVQRVQCGSKVSPRLVSFCVLKLLLLYIYCYACHIARKIILRELFCLMLFECMNMKLTHNNSCTL